MPKIFFDLLICCTYAEHVGAHALIHTATPYIYAADDPQKEIVDPAVNGTVDAIQGALAAGVRRVVVTSSGGAVFSFPPPRAGYVYTEKDWNTWSTLTNNPYFLSKRLAEQAAWRLWDQHKDRLDLVVVNPGFVVGPLQSASINTSLQTVVNHLTGRVKKATPGRLPFVDVRDVALAHVIAMEQDAAIGHRCVLDSLQSQLCVVVFSSPRCAECSARVR